MPFMRFLGDGDDPYTVSLYQDHCGQGVLKRGTSHVQQPKALHIKR